MIWERCRVRRECWRCNAAFSLSFGVSYVESSCLYRMFFHGRSLAFGTGAGDTWRA